MTQKKTLKTTGDVRGPDIFSTNLQNAKIVRLVYGISVQFLCMTMSRKLIIYNQVIVLDAGKLRFLFKSTITKCP